MNFFEDIRIGEKRELGRHTFTAEEIKTFAKAFDPQPFHLDEEAAAKSHFRRLCASGWHTAAVCMKLLIEDRRRRVAEAQARGEPIAAWGPSPGFRELKWLKPVYVEDTISFATEPVETRISQSRPGWGIVTMRHTGVNQHGETVYSILVSAFVQRRTA
ncbi:MAG TPA: MaoC family dehydratase [Xanthobacteraceae bacterium]|nr:MaoC family dehydratase [Xanthobacteraceae bacterium]